jgi:hypothetical protein
VPRWGAGRGELAVPGRVAEQGAEVGIAVDPELAGVLAVAAGLVVAPGPVMDVRLADMGDGAVGGLFA